MKLLSPPSAALWTKLGGVYIIKAIHPEDLSPMKHKFYAIATGIAVTSAIISTPAHAQITGLGGITFTVPETIFLRTLQNVDVKLTPTDLSSGLTTASNDTGVGYDSSGNGSVNLTTPFNTVISKPLGNIYSVFSNKNTSGTNGGARGDGQIRVTVAIKQGTLTGPAGSSVVLNNVTTTIGSQTGNVVSAPAQGLNTAIVGSLNLSLSLQGNQTAGTYSGGIISIQADAP